MRFFSILAAFLAIGLSLLFFNRLTICEKLLASRIESIGGHTVQLTVSRLNSSELTLASLTATFPEDSPVQNVKLQNLILRFSFYDLFRGQVAGLEVDLLQIDLGKKKKQSDSTFSYQAVQELLAQNFLPPFLPKTLDIKELTLSGPAADSLTGQPLQLTARLLDTSLLATLHLPAEQIRIEAELKQAENRAIQLRLDAYQATQHSFHLSLLHTHGETTGSLTTHLDTLSSLLPLLPPTLPAVAGEVELQFAARNTQETLLEIEMAIKGESLSYSAWDISSLSGSILLLTEDLKTFTFRQGSSIALNEIQSTAAQIDTLHFQFSGKLQRRQEQLTISAAQDSRLEISGLRQDTLQLEQVVILPALTFSSAPQEIRLTLQPEFSVTIREIVHNNVSIPSLKLSPETPLRLTSPTTLMQNWRLEPCTIMVTLEELHFQDLTVRPAPLLVEVQGQESIPRSTRLQALLHSDKMTVQWKETTLPLQDIQLSLTGDNNTLRMSGGLSHAILPGRLEGIAIHDVIQATGTARLSTVQPLDLGTEQGDLGQLVSGLEMPFSLSSGRVYSTVTTQWDEGRVLFIHSTFDISDGIAEYKKINIDGLQIQQDLQLFPRLHTQSPGRIFIGELTSGVTIKNIAIDNQLAPAPPGTLPTLLLDSIEGEVLGGLISSKKILLDPSRPEMVFCVQLNGLALEEIIKLIKMDGLSVTGFIDGTIPVQIRDQQIHVADGELKSRAPGGIINYLPPGGRESLSYLPEYVVQALEEFHYDTLQATPLYEPDGTLALAFQIKGVSPRLNSNRPVHLNLNTEQNLLSLLQSLRYSKTLTDDLEKQIQTGHPKH